MKKFKDFFYRKNDIFTAIIIVLIAVGIIFLSVKNLLDYPDTLLTEENRQVEQLQSNNSSTYDATDNADTNNSNK